VTRGGGEPAERKASPRRRARRAALLALVGAGLLAAPVVSVGSALPRRAPRARSLADRSVRVLDHELVYRARGDSVEAPVLLLHGFGGALPDWEEVASRLRCGRALSLDLVGFGASARPRTDYSLAMQAEHVVAFLDALGIERAVVVGQSMGASVAAWTAAHYPARVRAIGLLAPSAYPGALTHPWPRSFLYRPGPANRAAAFVAHTRLFEALFPSSLAKQALGMAASYDDRFADALGRIAQRTLLLWSPGDTVAPFWYAARFVERIPHARLVAMAPASGHDLLAAEPERVAELIDDYLCAPAH
jgi:pimeloyl-ACP methyl ester carboxylesterase